MLPSPSERILTLLVGQCGFSSVGGFFGRGRGLSIHVCSPENGNLSAVVGFVVRDGPALA